MRKILGPLTALTLLLACGCDSYNTYAFHGQLVTAERAPVTPGMAVHVLPPHGQAPTVFDSEFGITDDEGKFSGTLLSSTTWVPLFQPEPPILHQLEVIMSDATHTVTIPLELTDAQQNPVKDRTRQIDLGVIAIPSTSTTQPASSAATQ